MCLMVVLLKRTFYRNDEGLSTTCQCRQLKLNPLSTQINIYCLMTNQTPALLVRRAPWTRAAEMLLQSLYFSRPPPPTAIIPDPRPPRYIWNSGGPRRSREKIGDCEQSLQNRTLRNAVTFPAPLGQESHLPRLGWCSILRNDELNNLLYSKLAFKFNIYRTATFFHD